MKLFKMFKDFFFCDKYSKENIDKELEKIEFNYKEKGLSDIEIIKKQREYLDEIDLELEEQLKRIL